MGQFDEQPLERVTAEGAVAAPSRTRSFGPITIVAAAGLLVGAGTAWWWTKTDGPSVALAPTPPSEARVADLRGPAPTLPPLAQMDTFLRALLGALSSHPDFVRWLATDDLIRQMAHGIERMSRGYSPAADLAVLRPTGDFTVTRRENAVTIDADSFRRYDRHAALMDSLEARGVAEAYRTIQPRLDEAYRALGRTGGSVDAALDAAVQLLIDTPIPPPVLAVVPGKGATYAYRNPDLETLAPIQKQLLRMGPDNVARIQSRLRAIRAELARSDSRVR